MTLKTGVAELFTSAKRGSDETGDGTSSYPFKTLLKALKHVGNEPFPQLYVDSKEEGQVIKLNFHLKDDAIMKMWIPGVHTCFSSCPQEGEKCLAVGRKEG